MRVEVPSYAFASEGKEVEVPSYAFASEGKEVKVEVETEVERVW